MRAVLPTRRDDPLAQPRPRGHRGSRRGITVVAARSSQWVVWLGVVPRAGVVQFFWWQMGGRAPPPCWKRRVLRTQNEAAAAADESKGLPEDKIDDPYWKEEDEEDPDAPLPAELGTLVSAATHAACETVSNPHLVLT